MAMEYAKLQASRPQGIFVVDFETTRSSRKGVARLPIEITVRDGNGGIVVSCIINKEGVTNSQFETQMEQLGFDMKDSQVLASVRRVRGHPSDRVPANARTPKEIIRILTNAGLNSELFWAKYSRDNFDGKCMRNLILQAGKSYAELLPPAKNCWTVIPDLCRSLPGLASYNLGRIMKLIDPHNQNIPRAHHSEADAAMLYDMLNHWTHRYGNK